MKTRVGPLLRDEARRFALRFACEDCAHFDAEDSRCSLAYPAAPRRVDLRRASLSFCKSFELG